MSSTCSNGAFHWQSFNSGDPVPQGTIGVGHEADGKQFHACRVKLDNGSYIPAKFGESTGRGGLYSLGADEKYSGRYDLLIGDNQAIRWISQSGEPNLDGSFTPIEGLVDTDGQPLLYVTLDHEGAIFPGKAKAGTNGARFGYAGKEAIAQEYRILAYA